MEKSPHPAGETQDWQGFNTTPLTGWRGGSKLPVPLQNLLGLPGGWQVACVEEGPSRWALTDEVGRVGGPEEVRQVQPLDES